MARPYTAGQVLGGVDLEDSFAALDERIDAEAGLAKQFAHDPTLDSGLSFGYYGGNDPNGVSVADGSILLAASSTNYVELDLSGPSVSGNTTGFSGTGFIPLFTVVTGLSSIVSVVDNRSYVGGAGGVSLTLVAGDAISIAGSGSKTIGVADGAVTDAKLGNRTVDQTLPTPANTALLSSILSWFARALKLITGETDWKTAPATTLATAATHIVAAAPHSGHLKADGSVTPTAAQPMGGFKITNLAPGTAGTDAVNGNQLAAVAASNIDLAAVICMAAANTVLSGLLTIDSVTLASGNRVLLTAQTTGTENGLWLANASSWTRPADWNTGNTPAPGSRVFVQYGTSFKGRTMTCITAAPVIDTNVTLWSQTGGVGSGEANTTSNQGSGAGLLAMAKAGIDLPFKSIAAGSSKLGVTNNSDNVTLDVVPANIDKNVVGGSALTVANGGTGKTSTTVGALVVGAGTGALTEIAPPANDGLKRYLSGIQSGGVITEGFDVPPVVPVTGTSTTTLTSGLGSKSFTTQAGLGWVNGTRLRISSAASPEGIWMEGVVTAYSSTALTITADRASAAHSAADWQISIAGVPGAAGGMFDPETVMVGGDGNVMTRNGSVVTRG